LLRELETAGSNNNKNEKYQVWRQDNHPIELYSNDVIDQKLDYIHNNPVDEGIVFKPEDYLYSSAINYTGEQGLIDIERLDE
jgi:hypothetical protein